MNKNYIIFDVLKSSVHRYPKHIVSNSDNIKFVYMYLFDDCNKKSDITSYQYSLINNKINFSEYDGLITFGLRLPDYYFINKFNNKNKKTIYIQHGLYVVYMERNIKFYLRHAYKIMIYILMLISMKLTLTGKLRILLKAINKLTRYNIVNSNKCYELKSLNPKESVVYGSYWCKYHKINDNLHWSDFHILGYPDFEDNTFCGQNERNSICYIMQSMYEDGRLTLSEYIITLKSVSKYAKKHKLKLYIKLHPRTDISLLQEHIPDSIAIDYLPKVATYIGHYSSLLLIPIYYKIKTIIIKIKDHDIPSYITKNAAEVMDIYHKLLIKNKENVLKESGIITIPNNFYGSIMKLLK